MQDNYPSFEDTKKDKPKQESPPQEEGETPPPEIAQVGEIRLESSYFNVGDLLNLIENALNKKEISQYLVKRKSERERGSYIS